MAGPSVGHGAGELALVLRLLDLGLLVRWALPFRTWWAYVLALAAGAPAGSSSGSPSPGRRGHRRRPAHRRAAPPDGC